MEAHPIPSLVVKYDQINDRTTKHHPICPKRGEVEATELVHSFVTCPYGRIPCDTIGDIMQSWKHEHLLAEISEFDSPVIRRLFETTLDCIRELCTVYRFQNKCVVFDSDNSTNRGKTVPVFFNAILNPMEKFSFLPQFFAATSVKSQKHQSLDCLHYKPGYVSKLPWFCVLKLEGPCIQIFSHRNFM